MKSHGVTWNLYVPTRPFGPETEAKHWRPQEGDSINEETQCSSSQELKVPDRMWMWKQLAPHKHWHVLERH